MNVEPEFIVRVGRAEGAPSVSAPALSEAQAVKRAKAKQAKKAERVLGGFIVSAVYL